MKTDRFALRYYILITKRGVVMRKLNGVIGILEGIFLMSFICRGNNVGIFKITTAILIYLAVFLPLWFIIRHAIRKNRKCSESRVRETENDIECSISDAKRYFVVNGICFLAGVFYYFVLQIFIQYVYDSFLIPCVIPH